MNMSLILFLSSLLLGTPSDKEAKNSSEEQTNNSLDKINSEISIDQPVNSITISGNPKKKIMQDEFYVFTPLVKDIERNKLQFYIKNKPNWAIFDSRTGSLSGKPNNADVGISKNITISVTDSKSRKILLDAFNIDAYVIKQHIPPVFCVTQTKRIVQKSPLALNCGHYEDSTFTLEESMEEEYEYFYYDSLYETEKKAQLLYCSNEKDNNKDFNLDGETAYFVKNLFFDSPKCSDLYKNYVQINHLNGVWKNPSIPKAVKDLIMDEEKMKKVTSTDFFTGYFRLFVKGEGYNGSIYGLDTLKFINGHPFESQNLTDENGIYKKVDEEDTTHDKPYGHPENKVTKDKKTIFGTIYPNTFYIDGVQTNRYCFFEKTIYFESAQIKQKIYYVFYEKGGTKVYPFSDTIYRDLVVLNYSEDDAVKFWHNIKGNSGGDRCSKDPHNF